MQKLSKKRAPHADEFPSDVAITITDNVLEMKLGAILLE